MKFFSRFGRRWKEFLSSVPQCASSPSAFQPFLKEKVTSALKYLFRLYLLLSLLFAIFLAGKVLLALPVVRDALASVRREVPALYPPELVIVIENGVLRTNVEEPYVISFPQRWKQEEALGIGEDKKFEHLVTIDTKGHAEDFPEYRSVVLVTDRAIVYPDDRDGLRVQPLARIENFILDKEKYDRLMDVLLPWSAHVPLLLVLCAFVILLLFPFLAASSQTFIEALYLLPLTLILLLLAKVLRNPLPYGRIYTLTLRAATLPILYTACERVLGFHVPWMHTLILLGWMGVILWRLPAKKA